MKDLSKKLDPAAGKQKYEPTEREKTALDRYRAQKAAAPAAPRMKVINDKKEPTIAPDHPDRPLAYALLEEALGTVSVDFTKGLLSQLTNAGSHGRQVDEDALNFMLSVVTGSKPKDQLDRNARCADGRRSHGHHDVCATASQRRDRSAAG
jgi:hypothetical protein